MRSLVVVVVVVAAVACNDRERAELERRNAQLQSEKAELERALSNARLEAARLKEAQVALLHSTGQRGTPLALAVATRAPTAEDEHTLQAAQDAYVHGDYPLAIKLAKKTLAALPSKAWRVVGASSCFLKDVTGAREAYSRLGQQEREFLHYVCARNAIKLD